MFKRGADRSGDADLHTRRAGEHVRALELVARRLAS